jgi:hypothetical protein
MRTIRYGRSRDRFGRLPILWGGPISQIVFFCMFCQLAAETRRFVHFGIEGIMTDS